MRGVQPGRDEGDEQREGDREGLPVGGDERLGRQQHAGALSTTSAMVESMTSTEASRRPGLGLQHEHRRRHPRGARHQQDGVDQQQRRRMQQHPATAAHPLASTPAAASAQRRQNRRSGAPALGFARRAISTTRPGTGAVATPCASRKPSRSSVVAAAKATTAMPVATMPAAASRRERAGNTGPRAGSATAAGSVV